MTIHEQLESDFPLRDEVEDYAGRKRPFLITCHEGELGYTVHAQEEGRDGLGYEFRVYSETSPYNALGRLRRKMHQALATRHITGVLGRPQMLHERLSGRITCNTDGNVALVVDGIPLGIEDLAWILATHEGWEFELRIVDGLE